jgi:hypothetical protein
MMAVVMTTAKTVAVVVTDKKKVMADELWRIISGSEVMFMCNITMSGSKGGGSSNGNNGNGGHRDNSGRSSRNGIDWEVEQIKGTDSEETMSAAVELGTGVTAEDI